jgi:hypothetical protein
MSCTSTKDVDLMWEEFASFYTFIYSTIKLIKHAMHTFPNLQHFLDSWNVYKKKKGIPLVWLKCTQLSSWRLGSRKHQQS